MHPKLSQRCQTLERIAGFEVLTAGVMKSCLVGYNAM
jgi:hypothetical protein